MTNPFAFLRSFRAKLSGSYLGVDIGTTSIKAVQVSTGKQLPQLVDYGILESSSHLLRANKAFQTSSLKIFEAEVVDLLHTLLREMKPSTRLAYASLPSFSAFTTVVDLPQMSPSELDKAMRFQAREYVPLPLSEVTLEWLTVNEYMDDKGFAHQQVLLISVPREQVNRYKQIFKDVGLELKALEIENLSVTRALVGSDQTPTLILDIGSRSTNMLFVDRGQLLFTTQSDFAAASLTQALASSLNINPLRAEELKRERGIMGSGPSFELSTIMLPFLDAILNEVKKAQFSYQGQLIGARKPERVILSGGGANLLGIQRYVQDQLGLPTVKATPFTHFQYPTAMEPLVPELNAQLTVAMGLVLRDSG